MIYERAKINHYKNFGMGTTCVAVFVTDKSAFVANVGDSRAYLITDNGLHQITPTIMLQLVYEQGKITEEERDCHPQKNMLIRAVGVEKTVLTDTFILDYENKISLLLCSDGLSGYCSDDEIYTLLLPIQPFDVVADELINLALTRGGRDNIRCGNFLINTEGAIRN